MKPKVRRRYMAEFIEDPLNGILKKMKQEGKSPTKILEQISKVKNDSQGILDLMKKTEEGRKEDTHSSDAA